MALIDVDAVDRLVEAKQRQAAGGGVPADKPQGGDVVLVEQEQVPAGAQEILGDADRVPRGRGAERLLGVGQRLGQPERIDGKAQAAAACGLGLRAVGFDLRFPPADGGAGIRQSLAARLLAGGLRRRRLLPDVEIAQPSCGGGPFSACRNLRRRGQGDAQETEQAAAMAPHPLLTAAFLVVRGAGAG